MNQYTPLTCSLNVLDIDMDSESFKMNNNNLSKTVFR